MTLNLSIIKSPAGASLATSQKTFAEQGGTIGRGEGNDWVLSDPERFLSSKHCTLSYEGGQYFLTDTSTNGTFINGAPEPLGKGGQTPINNGDTVEIGDYQFRVEMSNGMGGPAVDAFAQNPAPLENDPFADDEDPFTISGRLPPEGFSDPFASDPVAQPATDAFDSNSGFGVDPMAGDLSLDADPQNVDPLAALDNLGSKQVGGTVNPSTDANLDPLANNDPFAQQPAIPLDDFLTPSNPIAKPQDSFQHTGGSQGDNAGAINQSIDWPEAKNENLIPEDWGDDFLGGGDNTPLESPQQQPHMPQSQTPEPKPQIPTPQIHTPMRQQSISPEPIASDPLLQEPLHQEPLQNKPLPQDPLSHEPLVPDDFDLGIEDATLHQDAQPLEDFAPPPPEDVAQNKPRPELREPLLDERPPERPIPIEPSPQHQEARVAAEHVNQIPPVSSASQPSTPPPRTPSPPRQQVAQAAGEALLEGLGLSNKDLSADDVEKIYGSIGELMPVIVNGMMQVLRSRASIKNEFRMNVTTIQPIENNPLKFSADAYEAIDNMFVRKSSAYMGPKQAFQEGFDGISEHQVAIIAGIREAFKSMMDRFDPQLLEKQFEKQNKGVILPGMQKAKFWSSYVDYYKGFVDNMENTFQYLFGDEFVQAYEDQLRRLAVERKQKQKENNN